MKHSEKTLKKREKRAMLRLAMTDEDPMSGVSNLFDVAVVFIAVIFLIFATLLKNNPELKAPDLENSVLLQHYSESNLESSGEGERLGAAYRLKNGDVVYVPEKSGK